MTLQNAFEAFAQFALAPVVAWAAIVSVAVLWLEYLVGRGQ